MAAAFELFDCCVLDVGCPLLFVAVLLFVELLLLLLLSGLGAELPALPNNDKVALSCGCVECRLCNELVGELLGANGDGLFVEFAELQPVDELLLPVKLETGDGASGDALLVGDSRE